MANDVRHESQNYRLNKKPKTLWKESDQWNKEMSG